MNIVTKIAQWQLCRSKLSDKTIGFVPTMGHLHEGHLSLCARSQADNDITVVSIFVNPAQFNQADDYAQYPRTLEQDLSLLAGQEIDYLLLPDARELYADHYQIQVTETELSQSLEGQYRPGHFNGMLTVVLKLLNLVQPARVYFGEKDYQQLLLVKKMARALFLPVDIIPCPTVRAVDGLALSSRNSRLTPAQREKAAHFPGLLCNSESSEEVAARLTALGFKIDYIAEQWQRRLGAVWLDDVRLIDNVALKDIRP
jgi:pantoate--beta-alanine ligase